MAKEDLISIITPSYNSSKHINNLINTVKKQTYKNWELIIINDGSNDNTKDILDTFKSNKIKIINLEKNIGCAKARNIGITKSNGRYITFLDVDDLWNKNKLRHQLNYMKKNNYYFCFTSYQYLKSNKFGKVVTVPKSITYKQALKNTIIFTSTVMIDTKFIPKSLINMPNIPSEDSATWWQILKGGNIGYGLNKALTLYRIGNKSLSSNKIKAIKRIWFLYRKQEKLPIIKSIYCFIFYAINAIKKRI